jgi:hypothetical protein
MIASTQIAKKEQSRPRRSRRSTTARLAATLTLASGALLLLAPTCGRVSPSRPPADPRQRVEARYAALPLAFEPNRGQSDTRVSFLARGAGYTAFLTRSGAVLALHRAGLRRPGEVALGLDFVGAARGTRLAPAGRLPGNTNYVIGDDPQRWTTALPFYARVTQHAVWPGVDVVWHGSQQRLEYDLVVLPGADPAKIRLAFAGATRLALTHAGDLIVHLPDGGVLTQPAPSAYERIDGRARPVAASYVLRAGNGLSVRIGARDRGRPLVIDPGLVYSTYLGGRGSDAALGIAVDRQGAAYVAGWSASSRFPIRRGALETAYRGATDAFVAKLSPTGIGLSYSTYLGGHGVEEATGIAVDPSGSAYVSGWTESSDFPATARAFRPSFSGGPQVFLAKLDPAGSRPVYSTYLGPIGSATSVTTFSERFGLRGPWGFAVALDGGGAAYVTGWTESRAFPITQGASYTQLPGHFAAFVTKVNPAGSGLVYSTYLGGNARGFAQGNAIAVDATGAAYVTGYTTQRDFPTTPGAFQTTYRGAESTGYAFVTKLSPDGSALAYSTYLGGHRRPFPAGADSAGKGIAVDAGGAAYVTGYTYTRDFPTTPGAFQRRFACCTDVFVTKLTPPGSALSYSTFLGAHNGSLGNGGTAIALDARGDAYVTGWTSPASRGHFPTTPNAFQRTRSGGGNWAFVSKLTSTGAGLAYSTYLGGTDPPGNSFAEEGMAIAVDATGDAYVTGSTYARDFPTTRGAIQTRYAGGPTHASHLGGDVFVTKLPMRASAAPAPPPGVAPGVAGAARVSGTVLIRRRGQTSFTLLIGPALIPTGSEVDTTRGRVRLFAATNTHGGTAQVELYGGRFIFRQRPTAHPVTTFALSQPLTGCGHARAALASRRHRPPRARHVWVTEKRGRFNTRGQYVSTSVQGTTWLTADTCTTSLVKVTQGNVTVRDLIRRLTVTLHAGQRYTARKHR